MAYTLPNVLMAAFIACVIVAGLFGPWVISVMLSLLVVACAYTLA